MKTEDIAISITGYSYSNIKETIPDGVDKEEIAAVYEEIIDEYLQKGIPREIPALMSVEFRGQANRLFAKNCLLCLKIQVQSILDLMQSWKTSVYPILEKRSTMRKKHSKDGSFLQGSPVMNYLREL